MASLEVTKKIEEKIISPTFWPKEYRQGFSEYHIEDYDNIGNDNINNLNNIHMIV